ncbi:anthranilate phosphoribosyltransferase [Calidifontibacter sp. DB0510]|uniref:Anthranilate phosphoribosyltransferase n=1 Tax=Metallococcus carri TaxID=1656884 RepID=A0A967EES6_9MICO|nr:anthranilate phosphoribosyltransferase [Metallococcus carri]NHN55951.1 anthranilate phosphoribosyltransferase [Metallococcus carri]NOP37592.1 anthranilate phosphoribosyltransferase [Calidifontibacter sp. DB2511S]
MAAERTWPQVLTSLLAGQDLSAQDTAWAMDTVMRGEADPAQLAGFLVALRAKGETVGELRGLADAMLAHAHLIDVDGDTLDIVGTGGDKAHTVNISTMSAIVAAGAGARVVKHGNRAATSSSGAADVLEALGVRLDLEPARVAEVAREADITFCFAQTFHPSFRHAGPVRAALGVPTAFNVLGPLTNPAAPRYRAAGVADARIAPLVAGVFAERGDHAAVFRGDDGLDELTLSTTSTLWWVRDGQVSRHTVDPARHGLTTVPISALRGGDAAYNAQVVRELLDGAKGPVRDAVVLNAGMALAVVASGAGAQRFGAGTLEDALEAGMARAGEALDSGAARAALDRWISATAR